MCSVYAPIHNTEICIQYVQDRQTVYTFPYLKKVHTG